MKSVRLDGCPSEAKLKSYLADRLEIEENSSLELHVEECNDCEERLKAILDSQSFAILAAPTTQFLDIDRPESEPAAPLIARYECLELLDVGGFGSVWKMRDQQFNRLVAVKVLKARYAKNPSLIRRFFAEAQICSQLTHPNIVPVHDMGTLKDGRPYFAMKLVEGERLDVVFPACELSERPNWMARIQTFDSLCRAMAFAHENSIIHRDLKPQNVMVGRHGEVQVMDWGLAKRFDDTNLNELDSGEGQLLVDTTRQKIDRTNAGALGTYAYMSPEQASNALTATERSDVFSLGAILCQLLTGNPPYFADSLEEISRLANEGALDDAFERLRSCGADSRLTELAMNCLDFDPHNRPENATAVHLQIQAYMNSVASELEDRKIEVARQQVLLGENTRRRRLWIGLSAALLFGTVSAGSFALIANNARIREANANSEARRSAQVADEKAESRRTIIDTFVSAFDRVDLRDEGIKGDMTAVELLQKTRKEIESPDFTEDLATKTELKVAIANAFMNMGRYFDAMPLFEQTIAAWRELDNDKELAGDLSQLSVCYEKTSQYDEAQSCAEEAIALNEKLYGGKSPKTLKGINDLAVIFTQQGKTKQAIEMLTENLEAYEAAGVKKIEILIGTDNIAAAHYRVGQFESAFAFSQKALRGLQENYPDHPVLFDTIAQHALILEGLGRKEEGTTMLEENYERMKAQLSLGHEGVLSILNLLGKRYESIGQINKAIKLFEEAVAYHEQTNSDRVYDIKNSLGSYYQFAGKLRRSLDMFKDAYSYVNRNYPAGEPKRFTYLNNVAYAHIRLGQFDDAIPLLEDSLQNLDDSMKLQNRLMTRKLLATGYQRTGQVKRAVELFRASLQLAKDEKLESNHFLVMVLKNDLAAALNSNKQREEAEVIYRELLKLQDESPPKSIPIQARLAVTASLGTVLQNMRRIDEAIPFFEKAHEISLSLVPSDNPDTTRCKINLGTAYVAIGRLEEGKELLVNAYEMALKVVGPTHRLTEMVLESLQTMYLRQRDYGAAKLNGREWIESLEAIKDTRDLPRGRIYYAEALVGLGEYQAAEDLLAAVENAGNVLPYEESVLKHLQSWLAFKRGDYDEAKVALVEGFNEIEQQHSTIDVDERWYASRAADRIAKLFEKLEKNEEAGQWRDKARELEKRFHPVTEN